MLTRDQIEKFDADLREERKSIKIFDSRKPTSVFSALFKLSTALSKYDTYKEVFARGFCNLLSGARKDIFLAFDLENKSVSFPFEVEAGKWAKGTLTMQNFTRACSDQGENLRKAIQNFSLKDSCLFGGQKLDMRNPESQKQFFKKFLRVIY